MPDVQSDSLIEVKNLTKKFPIQSGWFSREKLAVHAVSDVSFAIKKGETLGLVGESGCGKSTLGRCILRLIEPSAGEVIYGGQNLLSMERESLRRMRRKIQIIFQDPYSSLNPRMTVDEILREPLEIHKLYGARAEQSQRILKLLDLCGLRRDTLDRYPHEFSGGQRQRIAIARALAVEPEFIVCDEPVSALDVSIQAQILNWMQDLQREFKLTYLFIAHDLRVVEHISTRVAVMYLGRIVEISDSAELYARPKHPYTQALLSAIPVPVVGKKKNRTLLKGDVPSPISPPTGCAFHPRCPRADAQCSKERPELRVLGEGIAACHHPLNA